MDIILVLSFLAPPTGGIFPNGVIRDLFAVLGLILPRSLTMSCPAAYIYLHLKVGLKQLVEAQLHMLLVL